MNTKLLKSIVARVEEVFCSSTSYLYPLPSIPPPHRHPTHPGTHLYHETTYARPHRHPPFTLAVPSVILKAKVHTHCSRTRFIPGNSRYPAILSSPTRTSASPTAIHLALDRLIRPFNADPLPLHTSLPAATGLLDLVDGTNLDWTH